MKKVLPLFLIILLLFVMTLVITTNCKQNDKPELSSFQEVKEIIGNKEVELIKIFYDIDDLDEVIFIVKDAGTDEIIFYKYYVYYNEVELKCIYNTGLILKNNIKQE